MEGGYLSAHVQEGRHADKDRPGNLLCSWLFIVVSCTLIGYLLKDKDPSGFRPAFPTVNSNHVDAELDP